MNWYINRKKQDELVQAEHHEGYKPTKDYFDYWIIFKNNISSGVLEDADFQSLYGEAVVNNPMIPADDKPHIKDKFCDNLGCIPYIPEQEQADEEPVFPVCGTCNAQKEQDLTKGELKFYNTKPDSSLLLSEMKAVEKAIELQKYSEDEGYVLMPADYYRAGMVAELDHLAKPEMEIYKQVKCGLVDEYGIPKHTIECVGCKRKCVEYIPLSDYRKGEGK